MKISIITIISTKNFGAILQLYALYIYIKNHLNKQVEVINYRPKSKNKNMKQFLKNKLQIFLLRGRYYKSEKFLNEMISFTNIKYKNFAELKEAPPIADIYIVGSDQVWNSEIYSVLDFISLKRKISYASSIGKNSVSTEELYQIKYYLDSFNAISVRENSAKIILEKNGLKNIYQVLDPVFLLKKEDYLKLSIKPKEKKYILIYSFEFNEKINEIAQKISKKMNLKIVEIGGAIKKYKSNKFISNIGPKEFIGLIEGADFILTTSFHGTAFSLLFNKNFFSALPSTRSTRIQSLISMLNLNRRVIRNNDKFKVEELLGPLDYTIINEILESEIEKSKQFLIDKINSEKHE